MVGPSYKENEKLISWEGEWEKKKDQKADSESTEATGWPLSYIICLDQPVTVEWLR